MDINNSATRQAFNENGEGHNQNKTDINRISLPESTEELEKLLQIEGDKRVTQGLKTAQIRWNAELEVKLQKQKKEIETLARASYEQMEKNVIQKYTREIEEKDRALKQKELEIGTIYLLHKKGLPIEFKDFIMQQDQEKTLQRVEVLAGLWYEELAQAVEMTLQGVKNLSYGGRWNGNK